MLLSGVTCSIVVREMYFSHAKFKAAVVADCKEEYLSVCVASDKDDIYGIHYYKH
jgi:hypothetical protein